MVTETLMPVTFISTSPVLCQPIAINIKMVRKQLSAIARNKSIWPNGVRGEILKLGGEALILRLARLLDITINNATIGSDWKKILALIMLILAIN
jgi:hypothetical protein